jgi:hypothetical protein
MTAENFCHEWRWYYYIFVMMNHSLYVLYSNDISYIVFFVFFKDTWAKSGHKDGAAKAMALLKRMERLYIDEGETGMKPNGE